jgi:Fe-Mn family superoxide dismutase
MHLHHDKHHASYVEHLNAALAGHPDLASRTVEDLVAHLDSLPEEVRTAVRNQGGGDANHSFWWPILSKSGGSAPSGELAKDIDAQFGSLPDFRSSIPRLLPACSAADGHG